MPQKVFICQNRRRRKPKDKRGEVKKKTKRQEQEENRGRVGYIINDNKRGEEWGKDLRNPIALVILFYLVKYKQKHLLQPSVNKTKIYFENHSTKQT